MKLSKAFQLALNILVHSKLRSWLTIIGIVIGIAAVVSIVSISQGAQQSLEERLGDLGIDVITVSPGFSKAKSGGGSFRDHSSGASSTVASLSNKKNLTSKDVLVLKSVPNVKYVMGLVSGREELAYSTKTSSVSIRGVDPSVWEEITSESIDSGRYLTDGDQFSVVLGGNLVKNIFENKIPLNGKVTINGNSFKVVGILEEGSTVYMPITVARNILDDVGDKEFASISAKIKDVDQSEQTIDDITKRLMFSRSILKEDNRDFTVSSPKEMQETIQETLNMVALFLGAIAAISLIVGAIGIANTMFTSVLEKTKEIGIMKAIGTKNKDILAIFLMNSGLIGLVGGIGGVLLGIMTSNLVNTLGASGEGGPGPGMFTTLVTPELIIFALLFSIGIGMVAGVIPAYRASKLKPVDALRYE